MMPPVTLIIPTKNRPDFLIRLLDYYKDLNCPYVLFIGDSSDEIHAEKIKSALQSYEGKLHFRYRRLEGSIAKSVFELNQAIDTPYATLIADDDFLVPNGLAQCVDFLEENKDFTAANGKGFLFLLDSNGPYGQLRDIGSYKMSGLESETGKERLESLFKNYFVPLFSLHRTDVWKKMWQHGADIKDVAIAAELLPCSLSVIKGKIKNLDVLYLMRQGHDRRYILPSPLNQMRNSAWPGAYRILLDSLARALASQDNVSEAEARKIAQKAFISYLDQGIVQQRKKEAPVRKIKARLRSGIKKYLPFDRALLSFNRCLKRGQPLIMQNLKDTASPYHDDFMAVHQAMVSQHLRKMK